MLKRILLFTILTLPAFSAQAAQPEQLGFSERSMDLLPANVRQQFAPVPGSGALTEDEVGDVDSFGNAKIYLGVEQTLPVVFQADCTGWDPANGACIVPNAAPTSTSIDEFDLGIIELPASATKSILCFTFTQFSTWFWNNTTAFQATGDMSLYTTVQIENDVLLGLSDAGGNPFNGTLWPSPIGIVVSTTQHTLPAGATEIQRERITRSCTGGLVSARSLRAEGLTETQVKDFFKAPMTIRFGTQGNVRLVDGGQFFAGIRIYGDK